MEHKIQIMGFYSTINNVTELINKINALNGDSCTIQLLNADGIAGEGHILHATHQAMMAFNRKENIANDLGLEICVRASGQRQISKAIKILGLKEGLNNICVVIVGCNVDTMDKLGSLFDKRGDNLLNPDEKTLKNIYEISDKEMKSAGSIEKVMIERTTLLILETK